MTCEYVGGGEVTCHRIHRISINSYRAHAHRKVASCTQATFCDPFEGFARRQSLCTRSTVLIDDIFRFSSARLATTSIRALSPSRICPRCRQWRTPHPPDSNSTGSQRTRASHSIMEKNAYELEQKDVFSASRVLWRRALLQQMWLFAHHTLAIQTWREGLVTHRNVYHRRCNGVRRCGFTLFAPSALFIFGRTLPCISVRCSRSNISALPPGC